VQQQNATQYTQLGSMFNVPSYSRPASLIRCGQVEDEGHLRSDYNVPADNRCLRFNVHNDFRYLCCTIQDCLSCSGCHCISLYIDQSINQSRFFNQSFL